MATPVGPYIGFMRDGNWLRATVIYNDLTGEPVSGTIQNDIGPGFTFRLRTADSTRVFSASVPVGLTTLVVPVNVANRIDMRSYGLDGDIAGDNPKPWVCEVSS